MNRDTVIKQLTSTKAQSYIDQVEQVVKGVPHLPKVITDVIVSIIPWLVIVSGIFSAIYGIQYILYSFSLQDIAVVAGISPAYWLIVGVQHIVSAYLSILSFQLLRDRKYTGWVLMFWNMATTVITAVASIVFVPGSLIASLITLAVGIYLTFEVKPYYTGEASVNEVLTPEAGELPQEKPVSQAKKPSKSKKTTTKK